MKTMMSRNFQQPMLVVDREEVPAEGQRMLDASDPAHWAEVSPEATQGAVEPAPEPEVDLEAEMHAAAAQDALLLSLDQARAMEAVALTLADGGHDTTAWFPFASQTAFNIARMLTDVRLAAKSNDPPFRRQSSPAEIAKGAAVSKIISGEGNAG